MEVFKKTYALTFPFADADFGRCTPPAGHITFEVQRNDLLSKGNLSFVIQSV